MTASEIREKFLKFFESRGHTVVPSSSLLPDDPSVLFTTAGMQQFKQYYGDPSLAPAQNVASIQKCIRTSDIDEVGDESHLTFFEMLGNFSFGGYFKKEAIEYAHEFITKIMGLKIDYVSVFGGDGVVPADTESEKIWKAVAPDITINKFGRADNFWGPTGSEGPCGPTTEIYVGGVEIWNIVFNQYFQNKDGKLEPLTTPGIDTGMGLERLAMVVQGKKNIFETDLFESTIKKVRESIHGISVKSERVIADHLRAALFLIADGVIPSNKDQGYILRRLVRRVVAHVNILDMSFNSNRFKSVAAVIVGTYENYPELKNEKVLEELSLETLKFRKTLESGLKEFQKRWATGNFSGEDAYLLHESFGFPFIVTEDVIRKENPGYDFTELRDEYGKASLAHKEKSRAGSEKKFGGHGLLLDTGELKAANEDELKIVTRLHTATHLLHAALRKVLGDDVHQAGSDITVERTRFDFTFPRKLTAEEIKTIEDAVNEVISRDLPMTKVTLPKGEAEKTGALHFFKIKYPEMVDVYTIGNPKGEWFSKEFCGGPHVTHTGEIGPIRIAKEEAVSAGVRRIRAVLTT